MGRQKLKARFCRTLCGLAIAAMIVASLTARPALAQDAIRIGTSSIGADYYILAVAIGELLAKYETINSTTEPIGGSHANIFGLAADKVEFAIVNASAAYDGYRGADPFPGPQPLRLVAQGHTTYRFIVVRRRENIDTPLGLRGKTIIARRRAMPEIEQVGNALLNISQLTSADVRFVGTVDTTQVEEALRAGTVAGAVMPGSIDQPALQGLFRDGIVDFLYLDDASVTAMMDDLPAIFLKDVIPAGSFEGQTQDLVALGLNVYFVSDEGMSADIVYRTLKTIRENYDEFTTYFSSAAAWTVENALREPRIPYHPGAIRYYREIGAWNDEMENLQNNLLGAQQP
ncbi:MAG: TAXI family TRAP transporter solute-binding subunit [Micropepsaceae bacterium]